MLTRPETNCGADYFDLLEKSVQLWLFTNSKTRPAEGCKLIM